MTSVALHVPVLNADAPSAALESQLLRQNLHLTQLRLQMTDLVGLHSVSPVLGLSHRVCSMKGCKGINGLQP